MREVAGIVSALGVLQSVGTNLTQLIRDRGDDPDADIYWLATKGGESTLAKIADIIVNDANEAAYYATKALENGKDSESDSSIISKYLAGSKKVIINHLNGLAQMIEGYTNLSPRDINDKNFHELNFGIRQVTVDLLSFNRMFSNTGEVFDKLKEVNCWLIQNDAGYIYRFAQPTEMLAFADSLTETHPENFMIAALGRLAAINWRRSFVFRYRYLGVNFINIGDCNDRLNHDWGFAVAREPVTM